MSQSQSMNRVACIKTYFEQSDGRKVTMDELKELKKASIGTDRDHLQELAEMCAAELGCELKK